AQPPAPTMVAMLESPDNPARLVVSFDPETRSFLVTPAVLTGAAGHQHELWLIPPAGNPRSLGLVGVDGAQRIVIPVELLRDLSDDASIALSVEPVGGSPTGLPTGPVIASGKLSTI
ncbi:MAG: anti-sigma factor, partial [Pseudomonadota bacterium]|nr:anti-sigma factor [Pseudomonadota bacterium]